MIKPFHLSIGVQSLDDSIEFFEKVLLSELTHRDPEDIYVNIDFFGNQITLKPIPDMNPSMKELHFGINLSLEEFDEVWNHVDLINYKGLVSKPKIVDESTNIERRKFYLKCPTGYLFEIKGYKSSDVIYC